MEWTLKIAEICRQLTIHCTRWNCLKRISDTQKSWMQSKWADLQPDRAKQQMQDAVDAQAQSFAEGLPEVCVSNCPTQVASELLCAPWTSRQTVKDATANITSCRC